MLNLELNLLDVILSDRYFINPVAASLGPKGSNAHQSHRLVDRVNCAQDALVANLHCGDNGKLGAE